MAAWAIATDISDRYGSDFYIWIADRDKDGVVAGSDLTAVNKALEAGTSKAKSYIAAKYDIDSDGNISGVATLPDEVVWAVVDIAAYKLGGYDAGALSDEHTARYKDSIAWLRDIARGLATLGVADPPASVGHVKVGASTKRASSFSQTDGAF